MKRDEGSTHPRKQPRQARSRALVDAMLTATARVLVSEPPEQMTTNRIAEVAGVSIGSLYQYFPGKEALLAALLERELAIDVAFAEQALAALEGVSLADAIPAMIDALVASTRGERARLHAQLLPRVAELERDALVRASRERMWAATEAFAAARLDELPEGWADPDARHRGMWMIAAALEAAFNAIKVNEPGALDAPDVRATLISIARLALR